MDVVTAIAQQNIQVTAGQIGQPPVPKGQAFQLTINTKGRLTDPDEFANIVVKAGISSPATPASSTADDSQGVNTTTDPATLSTGIVRIKDIVTRYPPRRPQGRDSPGSNWTRSSTTPPARSTTSRPWRSRFTNSPAPTR